MTESHLSIKDLDFMFKNTLVKVVANRNSPEINLVGIKVGPFQEGKEYEVRFWIAKELEKAGITRFRQEELLDIAKLHKIHWKERVQSVRQISSLPEEFYPKLRHCLADLKKKRISSPEKMREYEKMVRLSRDIVNCRLKKIVSLASAPAQTDHVLRNLTTEERMLYEFLYRVISEWRNKVLKVDVES